MQNDQTFAPVVLVTNTAPMTAAAYGGRAKCAQRLIRLDMPVPTTVALSFKAVHDLAQGHALDLGLVLPHFGAAPLLSVRPSSGSPDWGGPGAILNIGMNDRKFSELCESHGETAAATLYLRFINAYATHVARLDPDAFDDPETPTAGDVMKALTTYCDEADEPFPQEVDVQLAHVLLAQNLN